MGDQVDFGRDQIPGTPIGPTIPGEGVKLPSNLKNLPVGAKGDLTLEEIMQIDADFVPSPIAKDTLEKSKFSKKAEVPAESDKPNLGAPDEGMVTGASFQEGIEEIRTNPWFEPSFLSAFMDIMNEILNLQRELHLKEAQNEIEARQATYELAKSSAELAKELMYNQAEEQLVQAVSSFTNAGLSLAQFVQTTRSANIAEKNVDNRIQSNRNELKALETKQNSIQTGTDPDSLDPTALQKINQKIDEKKALIASLEKPEKRLNDIDTERRNLDAQNQQIGQALQQSVQGVQSVLVASIKYDSGAKEYLQKLTDGLIQAMNKYSDTITKHRDEAASAYSRFLDDLKKIIESDFKAHYLGNRG